MRSDNQTRSLHYFHSYAVRDRLNLDDYDDNPSAPDQSSIDLELLLPSSDDARDIRHYSDSPYLEVYAILFEICQGTGEAYHSRLP